ncbi:hypothetical protein K0M31_016052 [Melipona bicolor]|uniref:Uncharacterized protein n=1 Tax=Melipona bicolor TaxID=60889 RepID=A0AA40G6M8_9HYME|nr:hypothetical protein K0M31_016052 [Melipona bicolor]
MASKWTNDEVLFPLVARCGTLREHRGSDLRTKIRRSGETNKEQRNGKGADGD